MSECLLSKEEFCNRLNKLKYIKELNDEIQAVKRKYYEKIPSYNSDYGIEDILIDDIITLLSIIMGEDITNTSFSDIDYFVYELEFGKKYEDGMVIDCDENNNKVEVDLSSIEKLYDYLIKKHSLQNKI